jgi:Dolichyl-phosphate-mannose-protein mannosyltransferase
VHNGAIGTQAARYKVVPGGSTVRTRRAEAHAATRGKIETDDQAAMRAWEPSRARRLGVLLAVLAAAGILTAALLLRVVDLGKIGFNSDEAVYTGQAAALAGDQELGRYFSPFRAHPLFVQTLLAILFRVVGVSDVAARTLVALGFGVGGVAAVILLTRRLYGWGVALIAGLFLALVPYHVILSRQVNLDVALALVVTLALGAVHRYAKSRSPAWLLLSAPLAGLATLAKETAVLLIPIMLLFFMWSRLLWRIKLQYVVAWGTLFALTVLPFAATRLLFETGSAPGYVLYQFLREPNHEWWYFPIILWESLTPPVVIAALVGLGVMVARRTMGDKLLLSWLFVYGIFFQVWPTKLFPYLIVIAPPLLIASGIGVLWLASLARRRLRPIWSQVAAAAVALALGATLVPPSILAATQGVERFEGPFALDVEVQDFAGGREVGRWIGENTPEGSIFLTIGPSMGNILSFYGHRDWFALSVNRDPNKRNPAYRPIINPDLEIRRLQIHYAIWDAYSADRSAFYNASLMRTVRRHRGTPIFAAWLGPERELRTGREPPSGVDPRIVVYSLTGGDPIRTSGDRAP